MRSCDGHGAASQGNDQGNWPNPKASLFTDPRGLPGRMTEVDSALPVLNLCPDHPHARGENPQPTTWIVLMVGPSPRPWGEQIQASPRR